MVMLISIKWSSRGYVSSEVNVTEISFRGNFVFLQFVFRKIITKHHTQMRMYWGKATQIPAVAEVMPVNRFKKIKQFFHCNDNNTEIYQTPTRTLTNCSK